MDGPALFLEAHNLCTSFFVLHPIVSKYRSGRRGTWPYNHQPGGILLCQRRPCVIDPTVEAAEGVWRPHRPLRLVRPTDKHKEYGWRGMLDMPHVRQDVVGDLLAKEDGEGINFSGATAEEGGMTGVWS